MIAVDFARRFIDQVSRHTKYNVNIMNEDGMIIASRDSNRVGQYHEVAYQIVHGEEDVVDTTGMHYPNVLPGINMAIELNHRKQGVVGVTGNPDEIRPIAMIVKMAFETMLKYEQQQELQRIRQSKKDRFVYLLTQVEHANPDEIRELSRELGYPEEMVRIPILLRVAGMEAGQVLLAVRNSSFHSKRDFSLVLDPSHVIIFKHVSEDQSIQNIEYRELINAYLQDSLERLSNVPGVSIECFIGSLQDTYPQYIYSYRHCKWLESRFEQIQEPVWFYDHAGKYLTEQIPSGELQHVFYMLRQQIDQDKLNGMLETMQALQDVHFNFPEAAEHLFIHKNTLAYRYNRIKTLLQIDPLKSEDNRLLFNLFIQYLRRNQKAKNKSVTE